MTIWYIAAVSLLLFPVFAALIICKRIKGKALSIQQDKVRDPRYFAKSFRGKIEEALKKEEEQGREETPDSITLSRKEDILYASEKLFGKETCKKLVVADEALSVIPSGVTFEKEIYARQDLCFWKDIMLRGAYANGNMVFGEEITLLRWADAEGTVTVYDNCDLGISLTSASGISIGRNCTFHRLYAPVIYLGHYPDGKESDGIGDESAIGVYGAQREREREISHVSENETNEAGVADFSVVNKRTITVTEEVIVEGDITSESGVRLCQGAVVCGNVFAGEDVILEKGARVLGSVFAQGSVLMEDESQVGQLGCISSVVARETLEIRRECRIYGYASCERGGRVCWEETENEKESGGESAEKSYDMLQVPSGLVSLSWKSLEAYDRDVKKGFRHNSFLEEIQIPEGVTRLEPGQFYGCIRLKKVHLPQSLTQIGDYAFADCLLLRDMNTEILSGVQMGRHVFDGSGLSEGLKTAGGATKQPLRYDFKEGEASVYRLQKALSGAGYLGFFSAEKGRVFDKNTEGQAVDAAGENRADTKPADAERFGKRKKIQELPAPLRRTVYAAAGLGAACLLFTVCVAARQAAGLVKEKEAAAMLRASERSLYGNQGMWIGLTLEDTPDKVEREKIYFRDRIVRRFLVGNAEIKAETEIMNELSGIIPSGVNQYLMLAPMRIEFEEALKDYAANIAPALEQYKGQLSSRIQYVEARKELEPYGEEYLFYRTTGEWTARGAYYGARAFEKEKGFAEIELSDYNEYMYAAFWGNDWIEAGRGNDTDYQDRNFYYLLPGQENWCEVSTAGLENIRETSRTPVISKARAGVNSYIGDRFSHAVLPGMVKNKKTLVLIGDSDANIMAPFFQSRYETVYVINQTWYHGGRTEFLQIFKDYDVSDVLVVKGCETIGNKAALQGIMKIVEAGAETAKNP